MSRIWHGGYGRAVFGVVVWHVWGVEVFVGFGEGESLRAASYGYVDFAGGVGWSFYHNFCI